MISFNSASLILTSIPDIWVSSSAITLSLFNLSKFSLLALNSLVSLPKSASTFSNSFIFSAKSETFNEASYSFFWRVIISISFLRRLISPLIFCCSNINPSADKAVTFWIADSNFKISKLNFAFNSGSCTTLFASKAFLFCSIIVR